MAIRETIQIGNPILKAENKVVEDFKDPKVCQIIQDLIDTMRENNLIGMAAPQIGENFKIFVTEPRETDTRSKDQTDELRVYINPEITDVSEEKIEIWEGCGCVANATLFAPVVRPRIVTVKAAERDGSIYTIKSDGILGRVIQHEYDHMDGIEFVERIDDYSKLMDVEFYIKFIKSDPNNIKNCEITIKEYRKF